MLKLIDLVTAKAIAEFWNETYSNRIPYLGEVLFPNKKKLGLDLAWIKGYKGLPIALKPSNFDATAELRDRIGVTKVETEMPFFREAMLIKEKDRQELMRIREADLQYYKYFVEEIFNDKKQLIEGALVQSERMRMQLLLGGKISISNENGVAYTYDFDKNGEYASNNTLELTGADKWNSHETSNPINDLMEAKRKVEAKYGTNITRAIMDSKTWGNLIQNKAIKMDKNVAFGDRIIMTDSMLREYLLGILGIRVQIYDKRYKDEQGNDKSFYPSGYVSLLPEGNIGSTWYGTTPEEADLMGGSVADVSIVNTGIAVTVHRTPHPVNVQTTVSEIVLPSFERMHETYLLKVF